MKSIWTKKNIQNQKKTTTNSFFVICYIISKQMKCVCCAKDVYREVFEPLSVETTL